jgi:dTDP-4-dehydrorhamnose 3,5-epimerase
MLFTETKLKSAYIIEPERLEDERGFLARTFCRKEFESHGLSPNFVQCNISYNKKGGTLRGMHYQAAPYEEAKLVRCTSGSIYDVIIDLRPDSPTYCQWIAVTLHGFNFSTHPPIHPSTHKLLYIPEGFAHGFVTLVDNTEVFYQMSEFHMPEYARGVRWNDPAFNIQWPEDVLIISDKDKQFPDYIP